MFTSIPHHLQTEYLCFLKSRQIKLLTLAEIIDTLNMNQDININISVANRNTFNSLTVFYTIIISHFTPHENHVCIVTVIFNINASVSQYHVMFSIFYCPVQRTVLSKATGQSSKHM